MSTKKSSDTYKYVETFSKTIGLHYYYYPSSNLLTMLNHTTVLRNPLSRSGMASSQCLNHHSNYRPDYRALINASNTLSKFEKKLPLLYKLLLKK
jgi:hypothetical protein